MDKKNTKSYESLFFYIKNNIFDMNPTVVITDYEQGLRSSIKTVFPNAQCIGCW